MAMSRLSGCELPIVHSQGTPSLNGIFAPLGVMVWRLWYRIFSIPTRVVDTKSHYGSVVVISHEWSGISVHRPMRCLFKGLLGWTTQRASLQAFVRGIERSPIHSPRNYPEIKCQKSEMVSVSQLLWKRSNLMFGVPLFSFISYLVISDALFNLIVQTIIHRRSPTEAHVCHLTWSLLVHVMAWCLIGAKTLPEPMLTYSWSNC